MRVIKLFPILFVFLLYIFVVNAIDGAITNANEYLNLSPNINSTFYINFYKSAVIKNLSINLKTPLISPLLWYKFDINTTYTSNKTLIDSWDANPVTINGVNYNPGLGYMDRYKFYNSTSYDQYSVVSGVATNYYYNYTDRATGIYPTLIMYRNNSDYMFFSVDKCNGTKIQVRNTLSATTDILYCWNYSTSTWFKIDEKTALDNLLFLGINQNNDSIADYAGKYGLGLNFNGNGNYINVTNEDKFRLDGNITISAWIYINSFKENAPIFAKWISNTGYMVTLRTTGGNGLFVYDSSDAMEDSSTITSNQWYFITAIFNDTHKILYINGVKVNSEAIGSWVPNTESVSIGVYPTQQAFFNGTIDNLAVWNRTLTDTEILTAYNSQEYLNPALGRGLLLYYSGTHNKSHFYDLNTIRQGQNDEAMAFDGKSVYLQNISSSETLNFERNNSFSFSFWMYKNVDAVDQVIYTKRGGAVNYRGIYFSVDQGGRLLYFQMYNQVAPNIAIIGRGTNYLYANQWYHVVLTYDGSSSINGLKMYVNGVSEPITNISDNLNDTIKTSKEFNIGRDNNDATSYFNGSLDDFVIYNVSLLPEQVKYLYTHQVDKYYPHNLTVYLANNITYTARGQFNTSINISDTNKSIVNNILQRGCNCSSCILSGEYCTLPVSSYSAIDSYLNFYNIFYNYSYGLDNCSTYTTNALNISWFNYNNVSTNINLRATFQSYIYNHSYIGNFSIISTSVNKSNYCISSPNFAVYTDIFLVYTDSSGVDYNFQTLATELTSNVSFINLYTQANTTLVKFKVVSINGNNLQNYVIQILKYDPGTNTYTLTESLRTDAQGEALGQITLYTTYYNFLIFDSLGNLVYTDTAVKMSTNIRTITITSNAIQWFTDYSNTLGVTTSLYFNNLTSNFVYSWADIGGLLHYGCLKIDLRNGSRTSTIADECTTGTSGTIIYTIPSTTPGLLYTAVGYVKYDNIYPTNSLIKEYSLGNKFYEQDSMGMLFIVFFLLLIGILVGIPNPVNSLGFFALALIISFTFNMLNVSPLIVGSLVIFVLIQIYISGRQQ